MSSCVFYDTERAQHDRKLFNIVESAYRERRKVLIFARTPERAELIDRILWVLKQEAFIPHKILSGPETESRVPVGIVTAEIDPIGAAVLIADGHCTIEFASGFEYIHEFVDRSSAETQETCRERYRSYRARQIPVEYRK